MRSRDERGAVAVLFALLALVLLGVSAFAIDFGQAYAKRSLLQTNVDLAALAAASKLNGDMDCEDGERTSAESFLTKPENIVPGQKPYNLSGTPDDDTGFVQCKQWRLDLWAPHSTVDLTLARVLTEDDSFNVRAKAAAGVMSPKTGVMPAYSVAGCDFGPQTLIDNSAGPSGPPPTPPLAGPGTTGSDTTLKITALTSVPTPIAVGDTVSLTIDGDPGMTGVNKVGFSTESSGSNLHYEAVAPDITTANKQVTVNPVPATVTGTEDVWYVRLSKDGGSTWSNAWPLQVGDAVLECESAPTDGNFGALLLYRDPDSSTDQRLALNMAKGLDFTLTAFPNPQSAWECTHGIAGAVASTNLVLRDGTNCVDTDTGLPASATEAGLITGKGIGVDGALANKPTNPACGSSTSIDFGGSTGQFTINNDHLTCFFTNGTTRIDQLGVTYSGGPVISEDILKSPRFYWVPVLGKQPSSGGSAHYQIVDFRPAFITDQPPSATRDNPQVNAGGTNNGIGLREIGPGKYTLRSLKVVFFNVKALPSSVSSSHPTMTYLGVGPKIISLVE